MTDKTLVLSVGHILIGPLFNEPMRVETVKSDGSASWIVGLVGTNSERFRKVTMTAEDLEHLTVLDPASPTSLIRISASRSRVSIRCRISSRRSTTTCSNSRAYGSCLPMTLALARRSCRAFSFASWSFAGSQNAS
jgi:hypothetical protein